MSCRNISGNIRARQQTIRRQFSTQSSQVSCGTFALLEQFRLRVERAHVFGMNKDRRRLLQVRATEIGFRAATRSQGGFLRRRCLFPLFVKVCMGRWYGYFDTYRSWQSQGSGRATGEDGLGLHVIISRDLSEESAKR